MKYLDESKDKFRSVLGIEGDKTFQNCFVHIRRTDYLKISQELDLGFYNTLNVFNPDIQIDIFTDEMILYDKF